MDPLDDYWRGEFTLREPVGREQPPDPPIDRLGRPEITVHGRNLAALLAAAYRAMTS